ncbi:lysylphosphatidylglycerol synthase transmembrane domain-containing protein [Sphingobacterium griseoflavum]|uniref:Flippase-like domain-containing protein n=1 Tax=Sphingobacterium griseoflavum TaxID=1474952 RepID=A0ABQ3HVZ0_9SPHI|nr:lysylphosphatidylglycerol synthase transmembrane domain-containing protein [Sphingobacterium griseoflavum]GHE33331.1 hypothetical protein GCM10017764_15540 [Sphingobacterium griseoflavum]
MDSLLKNKKWQKIIVLTCVSVPLAVFIVQTNMLMVLQEIEKIGFRLLYLLLCTFIAYLLGTWAWWICLVEERKRINIFQLFGVRQIGETVGLYNPTSIVGGDLLKGELLKAYDIPEATAATSIVISRITVVLSQLLLLIAAIAWLLFFPVVHMSGLFTYLLIGLAISVFLVKLLLFYTLHRKTVANHSPGAIPENIWQKFTWRLRILLVKAQRFYQQKPAIFWGAYLLSALHWVVGSLEFYFILKFLGYDILIIHGLLLDMGVVIVKSLGAVVPGQLGVEELGNKLVLTAVGIHTTAIWLAVTLLRRSRQLFWILVGILCYAGIKKAHSLPLNEHGNTIR